MAHGHRRHGRIFARDVALDGAGERLWVVTAAANGAATIIDPAMTMRGVAGSLIVFSLDITSAAVALADAQGFLCGVAF